MKAVNSSNSNPKPTPDPHNSTSTTNSNDEDTGDFGTSTCANLTENIEQLKVDEQEQFQGVVDQEEKGILAEENENEDEDDNRSQSGLENNDDNVCDGYDDDDDDDNNRNSSSPPSLSYVGKKPKWWKTLARRKGTKGQRNAISLMTQKGYVLPKLDKYQHVLNVQELISVEKLPRGKPLTNELLIPTSSFSLAVSNKETGNIDDDVDEKNENFAEIEGPNTEQDAGNEIEMKNKEQKVVHLEIGFGQGENLLTNAMMHPDQFFIGAEIHQPGVGIALRRMSQALEEGQYWAEQSWWSPTSTTTPTDSLNANERVKRQNELLVQGGGILPYDNLRVYPGDGVKILRFLPTSSIDNIYLTFPDPWPKNHQTPWRVIQEDTLELIRRALKPGGRFYLATDSTTFDNWTCKVFGIVNKKSFGAEGGECWREVDACSSRDDWLPVFSKYESKGIDEGRHTICRCWENLHR